MEANKPQPKVVREKIDYTKIFWRPTVGKHVIRIVPSKFDKNFPFKEVKVYYGIAKFPIYALSNWGEKDPIEDFCTELRNTKSKESWELAGKLIPKTRVMIPVVVRGEEHLGTRLWEVGKKIYMDLLGIADDEDYGDYTNILEGRDFTVEAEESTTAGRKGISCTIRIKPKTSKLHTDSSLVEKLLTEQTDILSIQKKYGYDELKKVLQDWVSPEDDEEETPTMTMTSDIDDNSYSEAVLPPKVSKVDKFEAMFSEK